MNKKLLDEAIGKMVKKELLKEDNNAPKSGQSKPVSVGNNKVVTVELTTGNVFIYNSNMTNTPVVLSRSVLELLLRMSKRKNTDEGGE